MSIYLIKGVSRIGKSSIGIELGNRGFGTIDTDTEFGYHANLSSKQPVVFPGKELKDDWYEQNGWIWNEELVTQSIDAAPPDTFYIGGARNESIFYSQFHVIFRLIADPEIMIKRLKNRGDENSSNHVYVSRMFYLMNNPDPVNPSVPLVTIDTSNKSIVDTTDEILFHIKIRSE